MVNRPTAFLTEAQIEEILVLLDARVPQWKIAEQFHVSKKTINRISTGETWSDVSQRYRFRRTPPKLQALPTAIIPITDALADILDALTAVKNHFALSFNHPIHWGWFDGWDGVHSLASDGFIVWESTDLVTYAQQLQQSRGKGNPIYADLAEEMPTFDLENLMMHRIGNLCTIDTASGTVARLHDSTGHVLYLHQKYTALATRMHLEIRRAEESEDGFVYLTKVKPKSRSNDIDPYYIPIACVGTLKE